MGPTAPGTGGERSAYPPGGYTGGKPTVGPGMVGDGTPVSGVGAGAFPGRFDGRGGRVGLTPAPVST